MTYNHTIRPEVINILGPTPRTTAHTHIYTPNAQEESTHKQSLWERIKSGVDTVFGYISQAVKYVKENVVPIAIAVAGIMNAWCNCQRCAGKARDSACYA